jgi:hypothetical protein
MKTEEIIKEMLEIINPVVNKNINMQWMLPYNFTANLVLGRIKSNLCSLQALIKDDLVKHELGIGLICRNLLTDFITIGYILSFSDDTKIRSKIFGFYNYGMKKTDQYVKYHEQNENKKNEYFEKYNDEKSYRKLIRDAHNKSVYKVENFPSTTEIIKELKKSNKNDTFSNEIKGSYSIWNHFSKYEHFGIDYFFLKNGDTSDEKRNILEKVLFKTSMLTVACLEGLKEDVAWEKSANLTSKIYKFISKE